MIHWPVIDLTIQGVKSLAFYFVGSVLRKNRTKKSQTCK